MITQVIGTSTAQQTHFLREKMSAASRLGPIRRKDLWLRVLARTEPLSHLARNYGLSRKFLYRQAAKASDALDEAFMPPADDQKVLFYLPVTKNWIGQFVLALVLICHSSFRGVIEILEGTFDYHQLSLGTVHNIVSQAVQKAQGINNAQDLRAIRVGAHDEIFQTSKPVLVGMDVKSTYCYLLAAEDQRDETTWGVHLLELAEKGLAPDYTIADGAQSLRAAQAAAWQDVPCHGDVFHAERDFGNLAFFLENHAVGGSTMLQKLERKMQRAKNKGKGQSLSKKLAQARKAQAEAATLAEDIRILADWMQNDILSPSGPDLRTRQRLYDFVVEELRIRESLHLHRIAPVRRMLENHRDNLLAFAGVLEERFADIAARFKVPLFLVMPFANCRVWIKTFRGIGNGKRSCAKNSQADFTLSRRPSVRCSARRPEPVPLSRTSTVACGTTSSYADISATIICICCVSFSTTAASGVATDPNASAKAPQNC